MGGVLGVWVGALILANWQPFHFTTAAAEFQDADPALTDEDTSHFGLRRMAWAPLVDYYWGSRYNALDQFVSRSLSFVPLGMLVALRLGRRERPGAVVTVLIALALGVMIEAGQYFIPERHPGTTDVLIQVLGAWLGFALTRHVVHALGPDTEARGDARSVYEAGVVGTAARSTAGSSTRSGSGAESGNPSAAPILRPPIGTTEGPGRGRPRTGQRGLVASFVPITGRLGERIAVLFLRLDAQPHGLRVAIICTAALVLTLAFVMLVSMGGS